MAGMLEHGEGDRVSRPTSLLLDGAQPEREPLTFDVQLVGAPPEVEQLVNNIKQVAEEFLYHWKTFPIVLPPSQFTGAGNRPSDVLIAPPCDELDAVALDAGVEPSPLSPKQLHSIREKGEFEVPSRHFPGQTHVWRVAGWLQRGRARARRELHAHVARAAALLLVVARDRLLRDRPLSVRAGLASVHRALIRLLDLIFGMPSLEARDLEKKIREERSRYLVAELICKPEHREDIAALAAWVSRAMRRAAAEKTDAREPPRPTPPVPCVYTTPQRMQVDLRLYRREVLRKAGPALQAALERESRGWFLHFRERLAADLARRRVPLPDIEREVRVESAREYVSRVAAAVRGSPGLRALGPGVAELLAAQLQATAILNRAEESVREKLEAALATAEARLAAAHPVLALAPAWRAGRLAAAARRLGSELRWAALEEAAAAMLQRRLTQHRYFLLRDLLFQRDREPLLRKELRAAKSPTREFTWATRIWLPQHWTVTRHFRGRSEKIPTVLSERATSIVTPRSDPSQPVFLVHKEGSRRTDTRWPGWRLLALAHRSWCWGWNVMFLLGVALPFCSPLSLRALLGARPFAPDYELSQVNGTLFPKRSTETQTMWSLLLILWRHVSKERSRFETEPDTGLLGKGLSRQANRVWNYGVVGGLGSLALLLGFPVAALAASAAALAAAASVPLWMPLLTLAVHLTNATVYDLDCPDPKKLNRWFALLEILVWRIAVLGVLQVLAALVAALLVCPLAALLMFIGGVWWWALRALWEECAWRALLSRGARVPAHDSAFCRRVAGPGLRRPPHYQISAAQAVCALAARGELDALAAWAARAEAGAGAPLRDYRHFARACFAPYALRVAKVGPYKQLEKECDELSASLRDKVSARRRELALPLGDEARARVRLSHHDLQLAIEAGGRELARTLSALATDEWWAERGLPPADWPALAANTLVEIFDVEVLTALSEGEARFRLEEGPAAARWQQRCRRGDAPPDVLAPHEPWPPGHGAGSPRRCSWGGVPLARAPAPALDVAAFSPRCAPHPPLPAPAAVALVLHNRESDSPIPLDSELCAEILKSLEDAPDCDDRRGVERYRGGGSEEGASEAASDGTLDDIDDDAEPRLEDGSPEACRVSPTAELALCRWTLTGRGVRLRADLASPEDVTLDERGTSV